MGINKIQWLPLTCHEAQIIEISLKGGDPRIDRYRKFLLEIGECLISENETTVTVTEDDLWFLRDKLIPSIRIGEATGMDVIKKVYKLLLAIEQERADREFKGRFNVEVRDVENADRSAPKLAKHLPPLWLGALVSPARTRRRVLLYFWSGFS